MSRSLTPALDLFRAGRPQRPIGHRKDGRPIFAIAGGAPDDDDPKRPDDVTEEDWDALGDPGKKALVRERAKNADLERQLAAAKARPAPPKKDPAKPEPVTPPAPGGGGDQEPDMAALIKQAVDAAIKPYAEADQKRAAEAAASAVRDAVVKAAGERLHDGTDGLMIDLAAVVAEDGSPDAAKITTALDELVKAKPHLAKDTRRFAAPGVGPTPGGATPPIKEQVQGLLSDMQSAAGIRVPTSNS